MTIIVTFSGGKDSLASLLWVRENLSKNHLTVFCDTGWENNLTYQHIKDVEEKLNIKVETVKSKKFDGLIDLSRKKSRFPSSKRRFCTSELKSIPMIDYILDHVKDDFLIIQGIRARESESRSKMQSQCNYFKFYIEPYGFAKDGKPKFHTYRRKEVLAYMKKYATDVLRPIFDWSAQETIDYIVSKGIEPNPLYKMGMSRVGCFPCVMSKQSKILQIALRYPDKIQEIAEYELSIGSSFLGPDKIPARFYKGDYPLITDVVKYVQDKNLTGSLFDDHNDTTSCMSYYGLCE